MAATTASFIAPEVISGTTTTWLPLTSVFPSVAGCASAFFQYPGQPVYAWDPGYGYWAGGSLTCLPPAVTTWWELGHHGEDSRTKLSIQPITCPQSWTTAATEIRGETSTLVKCCPADYTLVDGSPGRIDGNCKSALTSGQVLTYISNNPTSSLSSTVTVTTQSINAIAIVGYNVARATTGSSSSSTIASQTSSPTTVSSSSNALSAGAAAGIGVGAAVGVIAVAGLIFFLMRRKRPSHDEPTKYEPAPVQPPPAHAASIPVHEMHHPSSKQNYYNAPAELQAR